MSRLSSVRRSLRWIQSSNGFSKFFGQNVIGSIHRHLHATGVTCQDYYAILGIGKNATQSDIKDAYYALAKKYHPDVNASASSESHKRFRDIQEAYEALKDNERRFTYDHMDYDTFCSMEDGLDDFRYNEDSEFSDPDSHGATHFEEFFVVRHDSMAVAEDVKITVQLSFEEAVYGCTKKVSFQAPVRCNACKGKGIPPGATPYICRTCKGSGMGLGQSQSTCQSCDGLGRIVMEKCEECDGKGHDNMFKSLTVDIPAGVDSETILQLHGQGAWAAETDCQGDVFITIKVWDNNLFRRKKADIHVDVPISFTTAILGGEVRVPSLEGEVTFMVEPGTQHGHKAILKGKGIKVLNSTSVGDQHIHFHVTIPRFLSQKQLELVEEYKNDNIEYNVEASAGACF